jgi:hypothetical protein
MQPTDLTCNLRGWLDLRKQDRCLSQEEGRRLTQWFINSTQHGGAVVTNVTEDEHRLENFTCWVKIMKIEQHEVDRFENCNKILGTFNNFELNKNFFQTCEELEKCGCVECLAAKLHILISVFNDTACNDTIGCNVSVAQVIGELSDVLNEFKCAANISGNYTEGSMYCLVEILTSVNNSDAQFNTQTVKFLHLPTALSSKEEYTFFGIPVQQVGGTSGVVILSSIYVIGLVLNCILIRIFVRHQEMRRESKLIIINIAVADMLNLVLHSPPIDIFLVNSIHSPLSVTYVFYMIIGLNIYSVMMFGCHIYFTAVPANNRRNSGCRVFRRYSPHAHAFSATFLACVAPLPLISIIDEYYTVSLYVLITYCAVPLCCSTLFSVGTSLKLGLCVHSIHCGSTGHEAMGTSRARSANTLVALIVVTAVSYVPYCCLPFIPPYIGEQTEDHPFLISWVFVWFNSFINPIALYVANSSFRRHFNMYICFCCCSGKG